MMKLITSMRNKSREIEGELLKLCYYSYSCSCRLCHHRRRCC